MDGYRAAFLDWLACAAGGWDEPAAGAARSADPSLFGRVAALGAAGHVLDFDDTYAPGLAHCSAPVAPAALVLGAERDATMGEVLGAYAVGFETTAALARASHPELYRRGWHPTAVCGVVGAAAASASILGSNEDAMSSALALAILQSSGLRAAFGSDGKALQVGLASAAGARAAMLAGAGASAPADVRAGFEHAYGATWGAADPDRPAIRENWIKAYPCCLQTHSPIEAADLARSYGALGEIRVFVHAISLQAAPYGVPADPLQAKFSIPYTTAFTLLHGPPGVDDFRSLDPDALELAARIEVLTDPDLGESAAVFDMRGWHPIRIDAALGSPQRPMTQEQLDTKVRSLTPRPLGELVRDDARAADVLDAVWVS